MPAMSEKNYDCEEVVAVVDRDRYVSEFRDVPTFEACCKACPNYGNRWGCPPFDHDTLQDLQPYNKDMRKVALKRLTGTLIGAFWGLVVLLLL